MTAWLLLLALLEQSPECSISGKVYSLSTGAPLKRAQVWAPGPTVNGWPSDAPVATDGEGSFRIDHLAAGQYTLIAERNGYLLDSSTRVQCGASGVTIKLTPQGMIYGRVIDDEGEGVSNTNVSVYRRGWLRGERRLQIFQNTTTQADGTFVIGDMGSGKYYLSARGNRRPPQGETFVENFFPNTPDRDAAAPVTVTAGIDVRGVELRVRSARAYNIRGKAAGAAGEPVNGVPLMLIRANGVNRGSMSSAGTHGGKFEFQNVAPGSYVIQSLPYRNAEGGGMISMTAHVPVNVGEGDVDDVQVTLSSGAEISGSVKLDDAPFSQSLSVTLQQANGAGPDNNAQVKDGSFTLRGVAPTLYRVAVQSLLNGYYVKAMRFGGRDLVHRGLDLSSGAGGALEILLSGKPATISGSVRNSDGDPVPDATVNVWTKDDPDIRTARTDAQGHFSVRNFAPGEYRVIAWESIERGVIENPAFRASFENQAVSATLEEGAQANIDLKAIPKTASDAEVAKLP